jgi:hypothetical protein
MSSITEPGIYDIPEDEYHADPVDPISVSSSILKEIYRGTPANARLSHPKLNKNFEPDERQTFDLGSAAHALILYDDRKFEIIEADDYKTNAAKAARAKARLEGKIPLLTKHWDSVKAMAKAVRLQIMLSDAQGAFDAGKPQKTIVWREIIHGQPVMCRALLDWLHDRPGNVFYDFKSTGVGVGPDEWAKRTLFDTGADIQDAFYRRGIRQVLGIENPIFRFIAAENYPPYLIAIHELSPAAKAMAEVKVESSLQYWAWCRRHNKWPGHSRHVHYIDAPPWEAARAEMVGYMREAYAKDDPEAIAAAIDFFKPLEETKE